MDIEEIREEKKVLEDNIFKLMTDFYNKTTLLPCNVYLNILTSYIHGDPPTMLLVKVDVRLN